MEVPARQVCHRLVVSAGQDSNAPNRKTGFPVVSLRGLGGNHFHISPLSAFEEKAPVQPSGPEITPDSGLGFLGVGQAPQRMRDKGATNREHHVALFGISLVCQGSSAIPKDAVRTRSDIPSALLGSVMECSRQSGRAVLRHFQAKAWNVSGLDCTRDEPSDSKSLKLSPQNGNFKISCFFFHLGGIRSFRSFGKFSKNRLRRDDSLGPKIVEIGAILAIFLDV